MRCIVQAADGGICEATGPGEQEAGQEGALQDTQPCSSTQDHLQGNWIYQTTGASLFCFLSSSPLLPPTTNYWKDWYAENLLYCTMTQILWIIITYQIVFMCGSVFLKNA